MIKEQRKRLPVSVSAAVFIEDNQKRLLLCKQAASWKQKKWGPPAGGLHAHEDPIMNVLREAKEEIGVKVRLIDIVGIYTVDRGDEATGMAFIFRGNIVKGKIKLRKREISDARFFTRDEIKRMISSDLLYKPEYNLAGIRDWLGGKSFPLRIIRPIFKTMSQGCT